MRNPFKNPTKTVCITNETKKITIDVPTVDVITWDKHGPLEGDIPLGKPLIASTENTSPHTAVVRRYASEAPPDVPKKDADDKTSCVAAVGALRHYKKVS